MSILFIKALKGNLSCCHVNKLRHFWTWWCIKYEITNLNHKRRWKNWIIIDPSLGLAQFTKNSTQQSHSLHNSLSFWSQYDLSVSPSIAFYDSLDLAVIIPKWDFFYRTKNNLVKRPPRPQFCDCFLFTKFSDLLESKSYAKSQQEEKMEFQTFKVSILPKIEYLRWSEI